MKEELIRDRIVIGIQDVQTSERMQLTSDLTIEKALSMARQAEIQMKESKVIRKEFRENVDLNRVLNHSNKQESRKARFNGRKVSFESKICGRCGRAKQASAQH